MTPPGQICIPCCNNIPTGHMPSFAAAVDSSKEWVKKWLKRFREERAAGVPVEQILQGHSRGRKHAPLGTHPLVVEQVLSPRDQPPRRLAPCAWEGAHPLLTPTRSCFVILPDAPSLLSHDVSHPQKPKAASTSEESQSISLWSGQHPWPTGRWIAKTSEVCLLIPRARGNTGSKRSTSSTQGPRCFSMRMCAPISPPKRLRWLLSISVPNSGNRESCRKPEHHLSAV